MKTAKTLRFPARMGLSPRPYDAYDDACLRFWRATKARNVARVCDCVAELRDNHGCTCESDLDDAFTHGKTVNDCRVV